MSSILKNIVSEIELVPEAKCVGKVNSVKGLLLEVIGLSHLVSVGTVCMVKNVKDEEIIAEVVGIENDTVLLMLFEQKHGIGAGCEVVVKSQEQSVYPNEQWLGRVVNAFGEPIDGKGPLPKGEISHIIYIPPLHQRMSVKE